MQAFIQDARIGCRSLLRSPGFFTIAVLILMLGIGAETTISTIADSALLHPLSYSDLQDIVFIEALKRDSKAKSPFSFNDITALRAARLSSLEGVSGYDFCRFTLAATGDAIVVPGIASNADLFKILRIQPVLGHLFNQQQDVFGANPVALISEALWRTRFNASDEILGKLVRLDGHPYTVVGVFPASVRISNAVAPPQIWVPLVFDPNVQQLKTMVGAHWEQIGFLQAIARLHGSSTLTQAETQLTAALHSLSQDSQVTLTPMQRAVSAPYKAAITLLFVAIALLLLMAFVNIANLQIARATTRSREIAVRLALGASRVAVLRLLLIETCELALIGGVLGTGLAYYLLGILRKTRDVPLLANLNLHINAPILTFVMAVLVLAVLVFGLIPTWLTSRTDPHLALKEGGRGSSDSKGRSRVRKLFVVSQISCAFVLLCLGALLLRSFLHLKSLHLGFDPANIIVNDITLPQRAAQDKERWKRLALEIDRELRQRFGDSNATISLAAPGEFDIKTSIGVPGTNSGMTASFHAITPSFFRVLRIPLLFGRSFSAADSLDSSHVCIINNAVIRSGLLPRSAVLGQRLTLSGLPPCEIVGVVGDTLIPGTTNEPMPAVYIPFEQLPATHLQFFLAALVRIPRQADAAHEVAALVHASARELPVTIKPMSDILSAAIAAQRFEAVLVGCLAGTACLIASIGLFGLLAYSVAQRRKEIGIRIAVGCSPHRVATSIVFEGVVLTISGLIVGVPLLLALTRFTKTLLFGIQLSDATTYVAVVALLLSVAIIATAVPAGRAATIDAATALRDE